MRPKVQRIVSEKSGIPHIVTINESDTMSFVITIWVSMLGLNLEAWHSSHNDPHANIYFV